MLGGAIGPRLDGVAARQAVEEAGDGLFDGRRHDAVIHLAVGVQIQHAALLDAAVGVVTLVDGAVEDVDVPAVEEVAVVTVAGGVAGR